MKVLLWVFKTVGLRRIAIIVMAVYAAWLVFAYRYHFIDNVNLLVHEAGHLLLGFFGDTLGVLGGTLLQLAFPLAFLIHFWRKSQRFEASVCGLWLAESTMYTAEYMSDANAQVLPLLGDGDHDWGWLFDRAGVLPAAEEIGLTVHILASLGAVLTVWWAARIDAEASSE